MDTNEILDMIDHTLEDYVSPDAMRWTPEKQVPRQRIQVGDMLTLDEVQASIIDRRRLPGWQVGAFEWQSEVAQIGEMLADTRQSYSLGSGTITTVDENTGELVQTPFVTPLPGWPSETVLGYYADDGSLDIMATLALLEATVEDLEQGL